MNPPLPVAVLGATGRIPIDRLLLSVTGIPAVDYGLRWLTLLSANYLHGSLLHIIFNMLVLRQIGSLTAREFGPYRMFTIYTLSGVFGFGISYLAGVSLTIGASAAVCGLIGAMVYFGRHRGGAYGNFIYRQIGGWAIGLLIIGFLPGINNWGHGGGIAAGIGLGFLLGYQETRKENVFHKLLAGGCAVLILIILGWAVLSGIYFRFFV